MLPHSAASAWKPQLWLSQHGWQCPHQVLEVNPGVGWLDKARTGRGLWKREKCQCTSKTHVQPAWLQCSAINPRIFLFLRWRRFAAAFNTVTRLTSFSFFFLCDLLIQTLRLIPRPETTSGFFFFISCVKDSWSSYPIKHFSVCIFFLVIKVIIKLQLFGRSKNWICQEAVV